MATRRGNIFFGVDGGGTSTVLVAVEEKVVLARKVLGPANLQLLNDTDLKRHLGRMTSFVRSFPGRGIGIGLAGARTERDWARVRQAAAALWPKLPCLVTNDLETSLAAADLPDDGGPLTRVLLISGTGSCVFGKNTRGQTAQVGGWGQWLGDKGSGYEIGLRAMKASVYHFDRQGKWPALGEKILTRLCLNRPNDLIGWIRDAGKTEIAALADLVFSSWEEDDPIARDIINGAAGSLSRDALACARRLATPREPVQFILSGGVLQKQPRFVRKVRRELAIGWPASTTTLLQREPAWGAALLAAEHSGRLFGAAPEKILTADQSTPTSLQSPFPWLQLGPSPTEKRNPRSFGLHRLEARKAVELFLDEEARVAPILKRQSKEIGQAIRWISQALKTGGRLFYVGAGTSGRLGILDASECPPTFRSRPEMVQGIMAGGAKAITTAVEGAEDDANEGAEAIQYRGVGPRDLVVGIAASGRTPFVWGALLEARRRRAKTILLTFNPNLKVRAGMRPGMILAFDVGPEVLTGSTRLKAGSATKCLLNLFSTLAMVRMGKVVSNLMIDLNPSNTKLRDRAIRIVQELTGADRTKVADALQRHDWGIKEALQEFSAKRKTKRPR